MAKLKIDTGAKTYEIEDMNGKLLGEIVIYPNDYNFGKRAEDAEKRIMELIAEAEKVANDESRSETDNAKYIYDLDCKIKEQLDYMFNSNISDTVFNGLNCLNPNHGKYFIEQFLEMIVPVITKELEDSVKASNKRINKYASQASKR